MVFRVAGRGAGAISSYQGYYGSFYSTINQSDGTTPTAVTFNSTAESANVSIQSSSQVKFDYAGTYNIQFSAQLHNTGGGGSGTTVNLWIRLNGSDVAWTDGKVTVNTNSPYVLPAWNYVLSVNAGDYIQLMWFTDNANIVMEASAATASTPGIPSIILTAQQIR